MEAFEELIATSKEQSLILKGKRTKRQQEYTYLDSKENALGNNVENHKKDGVITSSSPSASWSSNNNPTTLKAEEDEEDLDIASCLILLSQGHSLPHLKIPNHETTTITHINLAAGDLNVLSKETHRSVSNHLNVPILPKQSDEPCLP
ncbi:hypothetical protein Bca4012_007004 [Brassica carinata]